LTEILGVYAVRVVLSTYGSRGDVEPVVALAVQLRELGAEVRVCAPPDEVFAELLARAGVPLTPVGPRMGSLVRPSTASGASQRVSEFAAMFDTVAEAAEGCDLVVATGFAYFASRSVADLGIGAAHDGPMPTTESLSVALKTALTPETRRRATAVAAMIRTDGAAVAAKLLLDRSC
jgi:UDP:flavonoid glycosyltransferase YjiC (YdhE family)